MAERRHRILAHQRAGDARTERYQPPGECKYRRRIHVAVTSGKRLAAKIAARDGGSIRRMDAVKVLERFTYPLPAIARRLDISASPPTARQYFRRGSRQTSVRGKAGSLTTSVGRCA